MVPFCGDGVRDSAEGCDDGAANDDSLPDACRTSCSPAYCGDGVVDAYESCDPGASPSLSTGGCRADCTLGHCGDEVQDFDEECDDGAANGAQADTCRLSCQGPRCGDGIIDSGEWCDDGIDNSDVGPGRCRTTCVAPSCGDGVVDPGEECDPGASEVCRPDCTVMRCGDGVLDPGEACDDGNTNDRDGCVDECGAGVTIFTFAAGFLASRLDFNADHFLVSPGGEVADQGFGLVRRSDMQWIRTYSTPDSVVDAALDQRGFFAVATYGDNPGGYGGMYMLVGHADEDVVSVARHDPSGSRARALIARPGGGFVLAFAEGSSGQTRSALQFWSPELIATGEVELPSTILIRDVDADRAIDSPGFCASAGQWPGLVLTSFDWSGAPQWSQTIDGRYGSTHGCEQHAGAVVFSFNVSETFHAFQLRDGVGTLVGARERPNDGRVGAHPAALLDPERKAYAFVEPGDSTRDAYIDVVDHGEVTRFDLPDIEWMDLKRTGDGELVAVGFEPYETADLTAPRRAYLAIIRLP